MELMLTIANNTNTFTSKIETPVPASRVHQLSRKIMQARNTLRPARNIQLTNSTDEKVAGDFVFGIELGILAAFGGGDTSLPFLFGVVPTCRLYGRVESDVLIEFVLLGGVYQVCEDLFLARILACPVAVLFE